MIFVGNERANEDSKSVWGFEVLESCRPFRVRHSTLVQREGGVLFRKEIPEKIRKTVSRRTESSCFLELSRISEGKGFHGRVRRRRTRLQLGTRRLAWILEQTKKKKGRRVGWQTNRLGFHAVSFRPCRFPPFSRPLSFFVLNPCPLS